MIKPPPLVLMVMEVTSAPRQVLAHAHRQHSLSTMHFDALIFLACLKHGQVVVKGCLMLYQMGVQAVCVLRGERPDWDTAKRILGEPSFMRSLLDFDKDNIPDSYIRKLRRYVASDPRARVHWETKVYVLRLHRSTEAIRLATGRPCVYTRGGRKAELCSSKPLPLGARNGHLPPHFGSSST